MSLRVSEIYPSFQGEGPNVGKPTTFVRFAGCNLKCPGWPCDTPHAIDPKTFIKEQVIYSPLALYNVITDYNPMNVCFTGGEVLIQHQDDLQYVVDELSPTHTTELFTNGTRPMSTSLRSKFGTIILDWKLPGSGEVSRYGPMLEVYPGNGADQGHVLRNIKALGPNDAIKFTIKDRNDYTEARARYENFIRKLDTFSGVVLCGPVWGAIDASELAGWMLADGLPWHLNIQTHNYVFGAHTRRT